VIQAARLLLSLVVCSNCTRPLYVTDGADIELDGPSESEVDRLIRARGVRRIEAALCWRCESLPVMALRRRGRRRLN
jgi:hypothetical protein